MPQSMGWQRVRHDCIAEQQMDGKRLSGEQGTTDNFNGTKKLEFNFIPYFFQNTFINFPISYKPHIILKV